MWTRWSMQVYASTRTPVRRLRFTAKSHKIQIDIERYANCSSHISLIMVGVRFSRFIRLVANLTRFSFEFETRVHCAIYGKCNMRLFYGFDVHLISLEKKSHATGPHTRTRVILSRRGCRSCWNHFDFAERKIENLMRKRHRHHIAWIIPLERQKGRDRER